MLWQDAGRVVWAAQAAQGRGGLGNTSRRPAHAQKIHLTAFADRRQAELQLFLCNCIDFKFLVIFRARNPRPFRAAAGAAWHPVGALANVRGEFGGYTGSS